MQIDIITLMPHMFKILESDGVIARGIKSNLLTLNFINPRDFTQDTHKSVDDRPFGGGPGMVMKIEPLERALFSISNWQHKQIIYLSPQGAKLSQQFAFEAVQKQRNLILVTGRYEGIDQRFIDMYVDTEISIGDYVLSGGELAALVFVDVVGRLIPGVLSNGDSFLSDSFVNGLLDHPHYTHPRVHKGLSVPEVLCSGHHKNIQDWRLKQSIVATHKKRPDLLENRSFSAEERQILNSYIQNSCV